MGDNRWGRMYLRAIPTGWAKLCYSYELPWREDAAGRSLNDLSRIKEGSYDLKVRVNGPKGWRLELLGTGHRKNIQVHRAAPNLFIQGCILPIHFRSSNPRTVPGADPVNKVKSTAFMEKIREQYEFLADFETGKPCLEISAILPATEGNADVVV
jgi:hypothetical protein